LVVAVLAEAVVDLAVSGAAVLVAAARAAVGNEGWRRDGSGDKN
jgi:hypothetical protein